MSNADYFKKHFAPLDEKLRANGFETYLCANGTLSVNRGEKYLGSVGKLYEFYCNSQDLNNPLWLKHIERIMKVIEEVKLKPKQADPELHVRQEPMVME